MDHAYVRLLCPDCTKGWESTPSDLPDLSRNFDCPGCDATHRLAEFMRTEHDLKTVKTLS